MTVNFVNLCPHALRLRINIANTAAEPDPTDIVVEPHKVDGRPAPARVSSTPGGKLPDVGGVAAYGPTKFGSVEGLPDAAILWPDESPEEPADGTIYLVSVVVGAHVGDSRRDVYVPGTGPKDGAVRDAAGQVFAVTRLIRA